jgi:CubicO group peptidase (beta-lactamase class C family)
MRTWLIACVAALAVGSAAMAQQDASLAALEAARAEHGVPGMSAAVWRDGEIVWTGAAGEANIELGVPASAATRYRLGSVAKVFTGTLAAKLAGEGRIDLDRPIREWMPDLPEHYDGVTLRLLLGHLAGVRHYWLLDRGILVPGGPIDTREYPTRESILAIFIDDPLQAPPGEEYSYTTFGFTLAGVAMEAATGERFEDLLRAEVLEPLALETIVVDDYRAIVPDRAAPYDPPAPRDGEGAPVRNAAPLNSAYKVPGGGLIGSAPDIARFGGAHVDDAFLGEAMHAEVFTSQVDGSGEPTGVGLAWRATRDGEGRLVYHHGGSQQGCRSALLVYPEHGVAVAVMSNLTGTPRAIEDLAQTIAAPFLAALPASVGGD